MLVASARAAQFHHEAQSRLAPLCAADSWAAALVTGPALQASRVAYLPVPKAGSTFIRKAVADATRFRFDPTSDVVCSGGDGARRCRREAGGVAPANKIVAARLGPSTKIFTFVAEPFERMQHGVVQEMFYEGRIKGGGVDLTALRLEMIGYATSAKGCLAPHVAPQADHLRRALGDRRLSHLFHLQDGRVEQQLALLLNASAPRHTKLLRGARRPARLGGVGPWLRWENLSIVERHVVCNFLETDYELLGYPWPRACLDARR